MIDVALHLLDPAVCRLARLFGDANLLSRMVLNKTWKTRTDRSVGLSKEVFRVQNDPSIRHRREQWHRKSTFIERYT